MLFTDVSGFTALSERVDPETVQHLMSRWFGTVRPAVEHHGGRVEKYLGDGVMAIFGVPAAHEDDALRAARAALELHTALDALNHELLSRYGVRLVVHTGLNTGEVVAGTSADGDAMTYGDAVNVAQRLGAAAGPGDVLLGPTTAELVAGRAQLTAIGPLDLKGKAAPVEAWQLERGGGPGRPGAGPAAGRPFVGRAAELGVLRATFDEVVTCRRTQLVTVVGAPGIGKSRFAEALLERTAARAHGVSGRCLPYGEGITYWPLAEVVRGLAGRTDEDAIAALGDGDDEARRIAARVARLLGSTPGGVGAQEAQWAVRRLLEREAARRPLVVHFDDLHWAEPGLLDLIDHIVAHAAAVPLLVVGAGRPELLESRPAWAVPARGSAVIRLGPLREVEAQALLDQLVTGDEAPRELLAVAEGNPLFLEQLVAARDEPGGFDGGPPATVQALLAARIDALPGATRSVIGCSAVEGRNFHRAAVHHLLAPALRPELDAALATLVRRELVIPAPAELSGQVGYRFTHILVRDVAYASLAKTTRAVLHERHARWLERHAGDGYGEVIGHHLEQAHRWHAQLEPGAVAERRGLALDAAARLGGAGRSAVGRGDVPAGVGLLERATTLLPADTPERDGLVPELGLALVDLGRLSQADEVLTVAAGGAAARGAVTAEAHALTARFFARCQVDSAGAAAELDRGFPRLEQVFATADDDLGLDRLWRARALVHWLAGHSARADAGWLRGVRHARRAGDEHGADDALVWLASSACVGPTPVPTAIARCTAILDELRGDRRSQALVRRPLASLHAMGGAIDRAHELLAEATASLAELGAGLPAAACHDDALVALLAGDLSEAERTLRDGCACSEEMGEHALLATTAAMLAHVLCEQGSLDEAWASTDTAFAVAAEDDMSVHILGRTVRARVLAARGDAGAAARLSASAVALAARTDWLCEHADALVARADVLRIGGHHDGACAALREALELYERKGNVVAAERVRATQVAAVPS